MDELFFLSASGLRVTRNISMYILDEKETSSNYSIMEKTTIKEMKGYPQLSTLSQL